MILIVIVVGLCRRNRIQNVNLSIVGIEGGCYPLVMTNMANWKITIFNFGKRKKKLFLWAMFNSYLSHYHRVAGDDPCYTHSYQMDVLFPIN